MSTGLVKAIKSIALDAVNNSTPMDLKFGIVVEDDSKEEPKDPFQIKVSHVLTLPYKVLIIPRRITEDGGLQLNDKVALLRQEGGNSYYVLDRLNERSDE
mgnify:CR=1 FL=1